MQETGFNWLKRAQSLGWRSSGERNHNPLQYSCLGNPKGREAWRDTVHLLLLFSCLVTSNSLGPHGLQHTKLPCPSPSPGAGSNSCPLGQWCYPTLSSCVVLFSSCLPSICPNIRVFSNELAPFIKWPKYCNFSISPSSEYSGLIYFRIDWLDLAVQGTLKSLLQHHNSKAPVLQHSAFLMVQLSHPYMTTWKATKTTLTGK